MFNMLAVQNESIAMASKKKLPAEIERAIRIENLVVRFPSGTVNIKKTRQKLLDSLDAYLFLDRTGTQNEELEAMARQINWKPFFKTNELKPHSDQFKARALEAFETLLDQYIEENPPGVRKTASSNIQIDPKVHKAVMSAYKKGSRLSFELNGKSYSGKNIPFQSLVGQVGQALGLGWDELDSLTKQIKAIQQGAGFVSKKGKGAGTILLDSGQTREQGSGPVLPDDGEEDPNMEFPPKKLNTGMKNKR